MTTPDLISESTIVSMAKALETHCGFDLRPKRRIAAYLESGFSLSEIEAFDREAMHRVTLHRQSQIERSIAVLSQVYDSRRRSHRATRKVVRQLVAARTEQMRMEKIHG